MVEIEGRPPLSAVERCKEEIRRRVVAGDLVPGQPIQQERLAREFGMSHIPVREALRALESQGLLWHVPNVGYAVSRVDPEDLRQIHLIRRAIEGEILRTVPPPGPEVVNQLREINSAMREALLADDALTATRFNQEFHFCLFRQANLHILVNELERLWSLSDFYRTAYLSTVRRDKVIVQEHEEMIALACAGKRSQLAKLMDRHRERSFVIVKSQLMEAREESTKRRSKVGVEL